jgi:hypothetical protein
MKNMEDLEIFCYCRSGAIDKNDLVIPPIKGKIVGQRLDGRVEFKEDNSSSIHFVYKEQLRKNIDINEIINESARKCEMYD